MSGLKVPADLSPGQYLAIEESLQSSPAGRSFLRTRDRRAAVVAADEFRIAFEHIRSWMHHTEERSAEEVRLDVLRQELMEMAASIRKAKTEISAMKPPETDGTQTRRFNLATEELDAIVSATERATSDILNGAEDILTIAGKVKKFGLTEEGDALESKATDILISCGFQDITGQRISKVVATLRYLEERVDAMIRIWGIEGVDPSEVVSTVGDKRPDAHLLHGPSLTGALDQSVIDALLNGSGAPAAAPEPPPAPVATAPARVAAPPPPKPAPVAAAPSPPRVQAPPPVAAKPAPVAAKPAPVAPPVETSTALDQSSIDSLFA